MKVQLLILTMLMLTSLYAIHSKDFLPPDSLITRQDSIRINIQRYQSFRENKLKLRIPNLNALTMKYSFDFFSIDDVMRNDIYLISMELYKKYYANDILLWNYRDSAYLFLDIKNMQNKRGLIQLQIPLSNFPSLFKRDKHLFDRKFPDL